MVRNGQMASLDADHGLPTRATYRSLVQRGFTPGEAANLTAYLAGIEVGQGRPWRLADIDRLLFLRELCRTGRLGADDGLQPARRRRTRTPAAAGTA
jgi:hypothetical protein